MSCLVELSMKKISSGPGLFGMPRELIDLDHIVFGLYACMYKVCVH